MFTTLLEDLHGQLLGIELGVCTYPTLIIHSGDSQLRYSHNVYTFVKPDTFASIRHEMCNSYFNTIPLMFRG